jgi:hypothetical protein
VQHAAQAGAQYVIANRFSCDTSSSSPIKSAVTNATTYFTTVSATVTSCSSNCSVGSGSYCTINVSSNATYNAFLTFGLVPNNWGKLTAQATVRTQ